MVDESWWWLLTDTDVHWMSPKGSGRSWWLMKAGDGYWQTLMFDECPWRAAVGPDGRWKPVMANDRHWRSVVGPDGWIKPVMATDEISMSMALMALGRPSDFRWVQDFPLFLDRQAPNPRGIAQSTFVKCLNDYKWNWSHITWLN